MLNTNISFENAIATIEHYTTPFKKGKHKGKYPLEVNETGFTCYANNLKVLQEYAANGNLVYQVRLRKLMSYWVKWRK